MKTTKSASSKSTVKAAEKFGFRVIVRGKFGDKRVRRVRTVWAINEAVAAAELENDKEIVKGLKDMYVTVLPPLTAA